MGELNNSVKEKREWRKENSHKAINDLCQNQCILVSTDKKILQDLKGSHKYI